MNRWRVSFIHKVSGLSLAGSLLMCASSQALDPLITPLRHQIERSRAAPIPVPLRRGEYVDLQLQYFDNNVPVHLYGVQSLNFVITSGSITNAYPARIIDATNGVVGFTITPTHLWSSDSYSWELPICGVTSTSIRAFGTVMVTPSIGYQNLTNTAPQMTTCDFATLLVYNLGLAPWPNYAWITNYVGAHGGGFVGWSDIQDKPPLYTSGDVDSMVSNLLTKIDQVSTNPASGGGSTTNYIGMNITNITILVITNNYNYSTNWSTTNIHLSVTNNIDGMTNMPATWDGDIINTNRLSVKIGGRIIGYWDTNGITLYQGTLQLWEEDLLANPWLYDGSKYSPSFGFAGHRGEFGAYSRGYAGQWGMGWCVQSNEVGMLWKYGIKLLSTNAAFDGAHVGDASGLINYPEPLLTSWLAARRLPDLVITNGSFSLNDANNTNRVSITTNKFTISDGGGGTRLNITIETNNTSMIFYDTTNIVCIISNNGIILVSSNASFSGNASGLTSVPEPRFNEWVTNAKTMTGFTITNSGNLTVKDSGGTTRFLVTGSTGATMIRGQDSDARYVLVNTNWPSGAFTNLNIIGKTNIWKYQYGIATNWIIL